MHPATWLFYAVVSFFLGLLSVASGGSIMLAKLLSTGMADNPEPLARLLISLSVALAALFLLGGMFSLRARAPKVDEAANAS